MTEKSENEDRIAFLKKKNEARRRSMSLDWTKDKAMSFGSSNKLGYKYLSIEKMKRNLLPVFIDCGLDFRLDYHSPTKYDSPSAAMSEHWVVECMVTLTDIDTGYSEITKVYGESSDSLDKGITKASTYALKNWLSDTFMLIDGIDPDEGPENGSTRTFVPKTDKEQEEVKSKVFANAIPPTPTKKEPEQPKPAAPAPEQPKPAEKEQAPAPAPKEAPKVPPVPRPKKKAETAKSAEQTPVPKPEKDATPVEIPPVPKPEVSEKAVTEAEKAVEKLRVEKLESFVPSVPQQNMFNRIFAYYGSLGRKGEITVDFAEQLAKDRSEVGNNLEAVAFIKKYPVPDDFEE